MGSEIEEKLKAQIVGNEPIGNIVNSQNIQSDTVDRHGSSEEVGVIKVNWKGLYQDCKFAWWSVATFMGALLYAIISLSNNGYFNEKPVGEEITKVRILEVTNYFGKKLMISGEITGNNPIEIRLPQKCSVDHRWIGHQIELVAKEYKSNNRRFSRYEFSGVENLCDSTEGYKRAKEDKEKIQSLVRDIRIEKEITEVVPVEHLKPKEVEDSSEDLSESVDKSALVGKKISEKSLIVKGS